MRFLLYSLLLVAVSLPVLVYGQGKVYSPLVNIPGNGANGFEQYISFLYGASISVAALLAVVKIIIAGAKYMMSDVITNKGEALSDIQGAILGLLLILGAVIILEFINPQLIKRDIQFQPIAEPSKVNARNSVTASGQTADELNQSLMLGVDQCAFNTPTTNSANGLNKVTGIDVSSCSKEKQIEAMKVFANNCAKNGGEFRNGGTGSMTMGCAVPIAGAIDAKGSLALGGQLQKQFGGDNVTIEGRRISVNIENGCYEKFKNAPSKTAYESCKSAALTAVELPCSTKAGVYGRFTGTNTSNTVICEMPKEVRTVDSFKGYDPKFPGTIPETETEFEKQCLAVNGRYIEDAVTTIFQEPYSPLNDRCIIY
jgi:hypothetical protein